MVKDLTQEVKILLTSLPQREKDVLIRRFGMFNNSEETLDAIGKSYDITRERVRQIQDHGLSVLKNKIIPSNPKFNKYFNIINQKIENFGGLVKEQNFLDFLKQKEEDKNYLSFLFVLNNNLFYLKENDYFYTRLISENRKNDVFKIETAVNSLANSVLKNTVLSFDELIKIFQNKLKPIFHEDILLNKNALCSWVETSKLLNKNIFGEWGVTSSCHITPKGIKDFAYLAMRRHGSPMHFYEVSLAIEKNLDKKAHIQTVHNELIKDNRFILVGRGLYALKEWGYIPGTVKDVIHNILKSSGKISKNELIKKILKERHVKETTIAINLQNKNFFKRFQDGTYGLV